MNYGLKSEFDLNMHKKTFFNYLEVIIEENGNVQYATPSHQLFLIKYACEKLNISKNQLYERCPMEYRCDFMAWLCMITKCVSVWNCGYQGEPNEKQQQVLNEFVENNLMENVKL